MILLSSDENKLIVQPENKDPGAAKKEENSSMGEPHSIQGALTFVSQEESQLKTASRH